MASPRVRSRPAPRRPRGSLRWCCMCSSDAYAVSSSRQWPHRWTLCLLQPLLHLVSAAGHAAAVGLIVLLEIGLLLRLRLLICRRRLSVRAPLAHEACRRSNASANRRALAGIATDGAADGAEGGASGTAPDRSALLRRRRRDLHGLRGIHTGLALRPVVALELITLELVLSLSLLGIDEHLGTSRAGQHQQSQHRADSHQLLHDSPPRNIVIAPAG